MPGVGVDGDGRCRRQGCPGQLEFLDQFVGHGATAIGLGLQQGLLRQLGGGHFHVPARDAAALVVHRNQGVLGARQHQDGAHLRAWKLLKQSGQQLQLAGRQRVGVVHHPNFVGGLPAGLLGGHIDRQVREHIVETFDQGFAVGREKHFDRGPRRQVAQALNQLSAVMLDQGRSGAVQHQAFALVQQAVQRRLHVQAVRDLEEKVLRGGRV